MKHYLWNMLTNIKNGQLAKKAMIYQTRKQICESLLKVLWDEGYISGYQISKLDKTKLQIFLKYNNNGDPAIYSLSFLSKPSRRIYYSSKQIWKLDSSKTFIIFSTNKGLMTIEQCKKINEGGEPLLIIK